MTPAAPLASASRTCSGDEMPKPSTAGGAPTSSSAANKGLWSSASSASAPVTPARATQ